MFNKKKCPKCKSNINKDFDFCPYCGNRSGDNEDWGMLGKNDFSENKDPFQEMFGGGMLNKMLGSAMKMLEKEMQKEMRKPQEQSAPKTNFELYINGKKINPKNIQVSRKPVMQTTKQPSNHKREFSEENLKKLPKLPRKEPATNVKRFSDKLIYEIKVPGVKSINDVSIVQLENSIEVKAISKTKVYSKLIPLSLPIINYKLEKNILVLELENRG